MTMRTAIITGITGQDGAYLSELLISHGYNVVGLVRSFNNSNLTKLKYLNLIDKVEIVECDLMDIPSIIHIIKIHRPTEIYNLAAQSSVGLSFEQPIGTISFNSISVLNLLESIRITDPKIRFYQASSSEMYGRVKELPINENTPMHPLSPYAISKATAFWSVVNYRESYGLFACNGILFNHESYLRGESFFVKKVVKASIEIYYGKKDTLVVGNIDIRRDFGYAFEYVKAMKAMLNQDKPDDYIICSGESISLREIINYIFSKFKISLDKLVVEKSLFRPSEIGDIYGDNQKAKLTLNWIYNMKFFEVLDILIEEELKNY